MKEATPMESTADGQLSQAFSRDKADTVAITKQQLRNIVAENANIKLKLQAMDNLQCLLAETNRRLNEAKTSLRDYKILYNRCAQRLDRQLRLLCVEVGASKTNERFGLKSQPWTQRELQPVLDRRTEKSGYADELITESEIEKTLELYGNYDSTEFYIKDIDTLNPEIVWLSDLPKCNVRADRGSMRDAADCGGGLVEYTVEEDGGLKSLEPTDNLDVQDDGDTKYKKGDSEYGDVFGTKANESSGAKGCKSRCLTSQGKSEDAIETAMPLSRILINPPNSVHESSDSDSQRVPSIQRNKGEMQTKHTNESISELQTEESDIYLKQKEATDEFQRKHINDSDHFLLSDANRSAEEAPISDNTSVQTTKPCACCTNAELIAWLTKQNARLKRLVRSILDRVSLTPASFLVSILSTARKERNGSEFF